MCLWGSNNINVFHRSSFNQKIKTSVFLMRYLLLLLLFPITVWSQNGPMIARAGDSSFSVELISPDTNLVKVYPIEKSKYDTIGGWHLVSDTLKGHWNPTSAMYLYEVRVYKSEIRTENMDYNYQYERPYHHLWLDSNKKPIKLKVWQ